MKQIERNKLMLYETILQLHPKLSFLKGGQLILRLLPQYIQLPLLRNKFWKAYLFNMNRNSHLKLIFSTTKESLQLYAISTELIKAIQKMNLLVNRSKYP